MPLLLFQMNFRGKDTVAAQEAAAFLKRSNLSVNTLGQVSYLLNNFFFFPARKILPISNTSHKLIGNLHFHLSIISGLAEHLFFAL